MRDRVFDGGAFPILLLVAVGGGGGGDVGGAPFLADLVIIDGVGVASAEFGVQDN